MYLDLNRFSLEVLFSEEILISFEKKFKNIKKGNFRKFQLMHLNKERRYLVYRRYCYRYFILDNMYEKMRLEKSLKKNSDLKSDLQVKECQSYTQ